MGDTGGSLRRLSFEVLTDATVGERAMRLARVRATRRKSQGKAHGQDRSKATGGAIDESLIVFFRPPTRGRKGIKRQPRERIAAQLPVTAPMQEVLDALVAAGGCSSRAQLARATGRTGNSVGSSLYALADRGVVEHRGTEWAVLSESAPIVPVVAGRGEV